MKKILSVLLALGLACSLAACAGGASSSEAVSEETASTETASSEATEETVPAEQDAPQLDAVASGEVMNYDQYMAADLDTEVTIQAYVQAKQSWWEDKATVYLQDQDGGYFAYDMACSEEDYEKLTEGTCIRVTGFKSEWSGEVEIMDGTFEFVEDAEPFVSMPLDVTELLGTDELIYAQNQRVAFKGLTVAPSTVEGSDEEYAFLYNWDGSGEEGDDLYFNVSYNDEVYTFTVESYLCDSTTDVYAAVKNLQVGQTIDAEGFLYWYEGVNPHITSITVAQ